MQSETRFRGAGIAPLIPLAIQGGGLLVKLFTGLMEPRGDFQKFNRTLYPYAVNQAKSTNIPVILVWFGDILRVDPTGNFAIVVPKDKTSGMTMSDIYQFYEEYGQGVEQFWTIADTGNDNVNNPAGATFQLYGNNALQPAGAGSELQISSETNFSMSSILPASINSNMLILAGVIGVIIFITSKTRK